MLFRATSGTELSVRDVEALLARMGATVMPPMPAFYNHPASIGDIIDHIVTRILDQFDIESPAAKWWEGVSNHKAQGLKAVNG
jgi:4-hydroxy-3-polyprenylbenzoate decarboxylase